MLIRFDSLTHNNKIIAVLLAWKQSTVCAQRDLDIVRREKHKQILRESFTRSFTLSLLMKISMIFSVHWKQLHTVNLALYLMPFWNGFERNVIFLAFLDSILQPLYVDMLLMFHHCIMVLAVISYLLYRPILFPYCLFYL